jgi:hypothetical protein
MQLVFTIDLQLVKALCLYIICLPKIPLTSINVKQKSVPITAISNTPKAIYGNQLTTINSRQSRQ